MKFILVIGLGILFAACQQQAAEQASEPQQQPAAVAPVAGTNEITIRVGSEFAPSAITVPKDQAVRLRFDRGSEPTCADEVFFPELGIRKKLPANTVTIVELPASPSRTLSFVCGMNMMKGTVMVQ
jgi:plastocyanin domain-containing protein